MSVHKIMEVVVRDVLIIMDHFIVNALQVTICLVMDSVVKVRMLKVNI